MKRYITFLALLLPFFLVAQQPVEDFRGLEWGTKLDNVTINGEKVDLELYAKINGQYYYFNPNEDLTIGTAMVDRILYVFDEFDRFTRLVIDGQDSSNEEMNTIIRDRFGEPDSWRMLQRKAVRSWNFDDVKVTMHEWKSGDYVLEFSSVVTRERKEAINSEVTDF